MDSMSEPYRKKEQVAVRLAPELAERLRNAVWHLGRGLTVNGVISEAAERAVAELEKEHNGGKPFPGRSGPIGKGVKV